MFRALGKLSLWLTLLSLLFWSGVVYHILSSQPVENPPVGYPANSTECKARWADVIAYAEVAAQARVYCDNYYAVLGDRSTPLLTRLLERTGNRIAWQLVDEYVASYPPQPGETVNGAQMIAAIGTSRIIAVAFEAVTKADDPSTMSRRVFTRCLLDNVRRVRSQQELSGLQSQCMLRR